MTSINTQNASMHLNRLFKAAAGGTDAEGKGLANKSLQIVDALADETKHIKLKGAEVDRLLAHVEKLPEAEKAASIALLDVMRDRFEFDSDSSAKRLLDTLPKTAKPLEVGGRVRTVHQHVQETAAAAPEASAKDIKDTDRQIDNMVEAAGGGANGEAIKSDAMKARKKVFDDGDVKASPEGGARKTYVESTAKGDAALKMLDDYANSPFFEDRLMAFLMRNGIRFMKQMDETTAKFDDPKRLEDVKTAFNDAAKKMLGMGAQLSPEGKARVATKLQEFLKANPNVDKELPAYRQWADQVKQLPEAQLAQNAPADDVLKNLPPPDNAVLEAMANSDSKEVREFSAVFRAAEHAEMFKTMTPDRVANMSEDDVRKVHGEMKAFSQELQHMKSMLPPELQNKLKDIDIGELPMQIDPTSRQIMFQQINMMMQQYQQIMQALSEIMNKMNEMAMDPIRKMAR